jgi:putative transposase
MVLAWQQPRYGYRRLMVLLWWQGWVVNHKRVFRIYQAAGLSVRRRPRQRRAAGVKQVVEPVTEINGEWGIDFVHDRLATGRSFRSFSVVDGCSRECLSLEVDTAFPSRRVTRVLDQAIATHGKPKSIRLDNGPELTSRHFLAWATERQIELRYIAPGKPVQNARVESFNGRLRDECLNVSWFANLWDARRKIGAWREHYNHARPHSSLGYRTPAAFAAAVASARTAVKGLRATQTTESRSAELRELGPQLASPLTAALAAAWE